MFKAIRSAQLCALLFVGISLAGCSGTIHRTTNLGNGAYSILAVDARQRLVISGTREEPVLDGHGRQVVDEQGRAVFRTRQIICTEPSPDAIVAAASYFSSEVQGEGRIEGGVAEAVGNIGIRTQTIQLLRDGYFRVCEAYLNNAIDEDEYEDIVRAIDHFMIVLVALEAIAGSPSNAPVTLSTDLTVTQENSESTTLNADAGAVPSISIATGNANEAVARILNSGTGSAHQSEAIRAIVFEYLRYITELHRLRMNMD